MSTDNRRAGSTGRQILHVFALQLAILATLSLTGMGTAQAPPPGDDIVLINEAREFVERKKEGGFIVRPGGIHAPRNEALDTASDAATLTGHTWVPACEEA